MNISIYQYLLFLDEYAVIMHVINTVGVVALLLYFTTKTLRKRKTFSEEAVQCDEETDQEFTHILEILQKPSQIRNVETVAMETEPDLSDCNNSRECINEEFRRSPNPTFFHKRVSCFAQSQPTEATETSPLTLAPHKCFLEHDAICNALTMPSQMRCLQRSEPHPCSLKDTVSQTVERPRANTDVVLELGDRQMFMKGGVYASSALHENKPQSDAVADIIQSMEVFTNPNTTEQLGLEPTLATLALLVSNAEKIQLSQTNENLRESVQINEELKTSGSCFYKDSRYKAERFNQGKCIDAIATPCYLRDSGVGKFANESSSKQNCESGLEVDATVKQTELTKAVIENSHIPTETNIFNIDRKQKSDALLKTKEMKDESSFSIDDDWSFRDDELHQPIAKQTRVAYDPSIVLSEYIEDSFCQNTQKGIA